MANPNNLTARAILRLVEQGYATCKFYKDVGVVKTVFIRPDGRRIDERPFRTAFIRPDRFRFEFRQGKWAKANRKYVVWSEGKAVQTWWDIDPGVERLRSLGMGLAGATGVSGGSAHTVPNLLLPRKVGGRKITKLSHPTRIKDGRIKNRKCFRIQGKFFRAPITLWIDQVSFVIRRIDAKHQFAQFHTETTTAYIPSINTEIDDKLLEFLPPC